MKERPILMNADMVRAILDGRKTQTRRPVKLKVGNDNRFDVPGKGYVMNIRDPRAVEFCPFGQPGDRLWVRETWSLLHANGDTVGGSLRDSGTQAPLQSFRRDYRATSTSDGPWRPSIHMPRWASRITMEITNVRVERVQDITEGDAMAEGAPWEDCWSSYRQSFEALWCRTYGPQSWSWNLWAWVIEFRRIEA